MDPKITQHLDDLDQWVEKAETYMRTLGRQNKTLLDMVQKLTKRVAALENRSSQFEPPTLEEVKEFFDKAHGADDFYDFYSGNGWKQGRVPLKDWKAAARRWRRNNKTDSPASHKPVVKADICPNCFSMTNTAHHHEVCVLGEQDLPPCDDTRDETLAKMQALTRR